MPHHPDLLTGGLVPDGRDSQGAAAAALRARARERLAREVHDELAHRVARVSLQVMGHRDSADAATLRWALDAIAAANGEILAHLWLLDRVLRAHPFDAEERADEAGTGLVHLAVCDPVLDVLARQVEALRAAGFEVTVVAPDSADQVGPLARRTLEEALTAVAETISQHAPPGSRCTLEVTTSPSSVSLTVTAVLPGWSAEAHGLGLVALHERVRLVGGTFWTGRQEHTGPDGWSLALRLRGR